MRRGFFAALLSIAALLPIAVRANGPVVRAVLFYSDTCPHCHEVIDNVLPTLQATYGERLQISMFEVSNRANYELFLRLDRCVDGSIE